ncbi:hypothetical protein [Aeromonas sobria]|nr:hypothetical protein [Aeromonas sobria]
MAVPDSFTIDTFLWLQKFFVIWRSWWVQMAQPGSQDGRNIATLAIQRQ